MGYCYTKDGLLCCDICGHAGGVRKHRCPLGWCQAIALCPGCRAKHPEYVSKAFHRQRGCEKNHLEFAQREKDRQALLNANQVVRCSALCHPKRPEPNVKVIFEGKESNRAFWMSHQTYDSIPLLVNATPDDYRKHGKIVESKNCDIYDVELEAVLA